MLKVLFVLFLSLYLVYAKHELYDGYALYQIKVKDVDQAKLLNGLEGEIGVDVWSHALPERPGEVLVSKELKQRFQEALEIAGLEYKVESDNIKKQLDLEDELLAASAAKRSNRSTESLPFNDIYRYELIDVYIRELGRRYPNIVTVVNAGKSFEGRDIRYLKVSTTNFQDTTKPVVMMESLLHCREWVGLPATLYAIEKLIIDVTEQDLLQNIDWIILPIANPDGYEFTHTSNRFWRKNRATGYFVADICMGVDLNRNFGHLWGTASSSNACTDTFHGSAPFSEPETAIIRDIILENIDRMELFLDIHSFGSMILYGFGNGELPANGLQVHAAGVLMADNIDRVKWAENPNYIVGNVVNILYQASGSAQDFAQAMGATLSYTFELPGYQNLNTMNGFLVDPAFIEQAGYETWQGIKEGARYALRSYRARLGLK